MRSGRHSHPINQFSGNGPNRLRPTGRIADEVIGRIADQMGAEVTVTIEIEAPNSASDQLVRTVTENARTLKFDSQGFETE